MSQAKVNPASYVKKHWSEEDREKAATTLEFVQTLMNEHNLEKIKQDYEGVDYRQHNRNLSDGIPGVMDYFKTLTKRFPEFAYDVKSVFVDGDFVTLHSHATVSKKHRGNERKGFNIVDTWRIEDGKLVEHWDSVQPLDYFMRMYYWMTGGAVNNRNGVF